jgi:hypothetical protein
MPYLNFMNFFCKVCFLKKHCHILTNWHLNYYRKHKKGGCVTIKLRLKKHCCWSSKIFQRRRRLTKTKTLSVVKIITSQNYRLHGFVPNSCEICYFMGSYHLHMNVMHYLNMEVVCTTFMCNSTNMHMPFLFK